MNDTAARAATAAAAAAASNAGYCSVAVTAGYAATAAAAVTAAPAAVPAATSAIAGPILQIFSHRRRSKTKKVLHLPPSGLLLQSVPLLLLWERCCLACAEILNQLSLFAVADSHTES